MIGPSPKTPAAQVREQLERLRDQGLSFDFAWKRALERVLWPEEKITRDEWKTVLDRGKVDWEQAYYREGDPPKGMYALTNGILLPEPSEFFVDQLVA